VLRTTVFWSGSRILFPRTSLKYGKKDSMTHLLMPFFPDFIYCNEPVDYWIYFEACLIWSPDVTSLLFFYSYLLSFYLFLFLSSTFLLQLFLLVFSFHLYCSQSKESIVKARKCSLLFFLSLFLYHISTG